MLLIIPSRCPHSITQQQMHLHWFTLTERKSILSSVPRLPVSNKKSYCQMISSISDENCFLLKNHLGGHQTELWLVIFRFKHTQYTFSTQSLISQPSFPWNFCGSDHLNHRCNWHPAGFEYLKVVLIPVWHLLDGLQHGASNSTGE